MTLPRLVHDRMINFGTAVMVPSIAIIARHHVFDVVGAIACRAASLPLWIVHFRSCHAGGIDEDFYRMFEPNFLAAEPQTL